MTHLHPITFIGEERGTPCLSAKKGIELVTHSSSPVRVLESLSDGGWFKCVWKRVFSGRIRDFGERLVDIVLGSSNHGMSIGGSSRWGRRKVT